ncbi:MAG: putative bifunctional diguanylate cyclase/phosphodiesterase [Woeseiaceae bacterium]
MTSDIFPVAPSESSQIQVKLKRARNELDWLYALEQKIDEAPHGQAKLARLVGELTRFLNMSYSVLLVPAKNIRISVTHSSWNGVDRRRLDEKMMRRLYPRYSRSERPVVLQLPKLPPGARGNPSDYQLVLQPLRDQSDEANGVLATFCQVDGHALANTIDRQILHVARLAQRVIDESYDGLTGLMKRDDFMSVLEASSAELTMGQDAHCLAYFDIDQLQMVNDTFDSAAGDDVLVRFAKLFQELAPSGASLGRISGDKFAALLRFRDVESGMQFAESVRTRCHELVYLRGDQSIPITVSAGLVGLNDYRGHDESPLVAARLACDKAKDHGRDRVATYDEDDKSIVRRVDSLQLFSRLQDAIAAEEFVLDAQPIVALKSGNSAFASHYEVLLRMRGQSGEVLLPDQFFEAAEQFQLMPKLDRFVLKRFFEQIDAIDSELAVADMAFAINLSGQSLGDPAFHQYVADMVQSSGLQPGQLCFEITETAAIANREAAIQFMNAMRGIGCRFALDDFGAGLSSFAYLRDMPVDILKIDGSFVKELATSKVAESMVAAISQVARVMELDTVAEFVETEAVKTGLERLDVDYAQGFLLGRPRPLQQVLDELTGNAGASIVDITNRLEARGKQIS